ncbi:MAG: hypothetical protein ABWX96_17945 [Propionibacteriaceae bacterium]
MSPFDLVILLALVGWAIYKQTRVAEVSSGPARFTMAGIYVVLGLVLGGFAIPKGALGIALIVSGLVLSLVVGILRGRWTRVWVDIDGRVLRQGTRVTVALFVGLIATKFALGTLAYFWHVDDGAGLGEVLVMIAVMIAVQAELVSRRAAELRSRTAPSPVEPLARAER